METIKKAALVLVGIVLGCGGAAVVPIAVSSAKPEPGKWACYSTDEFDGVADASATMNAIAPNVAAGTVITTPPPFNEHGYICVKN